MPPTMPSTAPNPRARISNDSSETLVSEFYQCHRGSETDATVFRAQSFVIRHLLMREPVRELIAVAVHQPASLSLRGSWHDIMVH